MKNNRQQAKNREPIGREEPLLKKRREILQIAGIGVLGGLMTQDAKGVQKSRKNFKVLGENDRFDVGDRGKEMIDMAAYCAKTLEKRPKKTARK